MVKRIHGGTSGQARESVHQVDDVYTDEHPQSHSRDSRKSMLGAGLDRVAKPATRTVPIALTAPGMDWSRVKGSVTSGSKNLKRRRIWPRPL